MRQMVLTESIRAHSDITHGMHSATCHLRAFSVIYAWTRTKSNLNQKSITLLLSLGSCLCNFGNALYNPSNYYKIVIWSRINDGLTSLYLCCASTELYTIGKRNDIISSNKNYPLGIWKNKPCVIIPSVHSIERIWKTYNNTIGHDIIYALLLCLLVSNISNASQ